MISLSEGGGHELENMALDESNLEAMLFVDDGNGREENDTISGRQ